MNNRIVVKIGSSSLTSDEGGLNRSKLDFFASELSALKQAGNEVVLVTSGAVAAGFRVLGFTSRPKLLHEKQASAAVGQALLMQAYQESFGRTGHIAAQILLTRADFSNRRRIESAMMTMEELLRQGAIPIINENDTVATEELNKFGDNDMLSSLVANLVKASQLIILTDTDGLYTADPRFHQDAKRIERVTELSEEIMQLAGGSGSSVGTGGMRSKLEAARIAMRGGVPAFVGRAVEPGDVKLAVDGVGKGTYFETSNGNLPVKKQWLGFHSMPLGRIIVDEGAELALRNSGSSLLPAGVRQSEGDFHAGDVVEVIGLDGDTIGRGVVNYDAWQLKAVAGMNSDEVKQRIDVHRIEVIHRDEWITLKA
ncbi:glutamate 5-kinase [Paenibacillus xylaniclasticus]|uniref:glutamate 5-kinase n=1 Tax=Paenibacillus xylaniclasticus TaxID=588083 RepID=UPI000FDBD6A1|nr:MULTISPECIES: glutamate 5-kinase [Paenibacillus]GFN30710.1 glutamate 5-kinase [Paenibacillus curdlanolyticus]